MTDLPWWTTISSAKLLHLRERLLGYLRAEFATSLRGDIEDIVQQAFVTLFRQRERVAAEHDGLYRYLKTVARHAALDRIGIARRRKDRLPEIASHRSSHFAVTGESATHPATVAAAAEQNEKILKVFCALDDVDRLVLWRYAVDGQAVRAIARDLGLTWYSAAAILEKALRALRKELLC